MASDRPGPAAGEFRRPLARWTLPLGWVGMAAAAAASLAGALPDGPLRYLPLVASGVLFGLPHGAVDHLAPAWARGERPTRRTFARVGLLYAVLGGAYAAAWFVAPAASFLFFLLLTLVHWGQGDAYAAVSLGPAPTHLSGTASRLSAAAVRGGLPMIVPLAAFPDVYREVATLVVGAFGPEAAAGVDPLFAPTVRLGLAGGLAALTLAHLAAGAERSRAWAFDAGELALLWAAFALTPPIVAVGTYFTVWHAPRHVARLLAVDDGARSALIGADLRGALARFARVAAPLTVGAVVVIAGLWLLTPRPPSGIAGVAALYLVGLAALTLPHFVVVAAMDDAEALWRPGAAADG